MSKQGEDTQNAQITKKKLTRHVHFRLSEAEYAAVADELTVSGLTLSAYARALTEKRRSASAEDSLS